MDKPLKSTIYHWVKVPFDLERFKARTGEDGGKGYYIYGYTSSPPKLGNYIRTSYIIREYEKAPGYENETWRLVETRNSFYKLDLETEKKDT